MTSGRRPVTPPRGRVTLAEAGELSGLSYPEVHRRVTAGTAPAERDPETGVWTMLRKDALRLTRRKPAQVRPGTNLRAAPERWQAWEQAAQARGMSVSQLAGKLLDAASGWREGGVFFTADGRPRQP